MFKHRRLYVPLFLLASVVGCGPPEVEQQCVPIDEKLGTVSHQWCDGEPYPITLLWQDEIPIDTMAVCVAPEADETCKRCPTTEVTDTVETKMYEILAEYRPECQLQHWELGCMRTIENGMVLGHEAGYCCFQVAVWGDDACK